MLYRGRQKRILTYIKTSLILTDAICCNMAFVAAFLWAGSIRPIPEQVFSDDFYSLLVLFNLLAIVAVLHLRLYADNTIERLEYVRNATWKSTITLLLVFTGYMLLEHQFAGVGRFLFALAGTVVVYILLSRFLLRYIYAVRLHR